MQVTNNNHPQETYWRVYVLMLKNVAQAKGITHQDIADRTGLLRSNVSRLFSLKYCPSLKIFISISIAIGMNWFLEDKEGTTELNVEFEKAMSELGRRPDNLFIN